MKKHFEQTDRTFIIFNTIINDIDIRDKNRIILKFVMQIYSCFLFGISGKYSYEFDVIVLLLLGYLKLVSCKI